MRTIGGDMATLLSSNAHTLATMLRLELRDGTILGFTDHNDELAYDVGGGSVTYVPWTGILPSDVTLVAGFEASNFEVTGPISETVTRAAVLGGRFTSADAKLFMVNHKDLTDGHVPIMRGRVGESRVEGSRFVLEVRNAARIFNEVQGRVLSPYCSAEFGDTQCGVARTPVAATVTAVTDDFRFTLNIGGSYVDDYFNLGSVDWLTGDLAGTSESKVFDYNGTTGAVVLFEPMVAAPEIGDTLNIYRGCSKLLKSDDASLPTCLSHDNVVNFRGWPEVPGSRSYHRVNAPGTSYE